MEQIKNIICEKTTTQLENIITCVAFNKNKPGRKLQPDIYGCNVKNVWLVGYGLDDKQTKRNWTELYAVPKNDPNMMTDDDKEIFF